ncbi:unknown [Prevotella sp. CAG:1058]|nr:unknown [Prevotella sp. CAG:1058]
MVLAIAKGQNCGIKAKDTHKQTTCHKKRFTIYIQLHNSCLVPNFTSACSNFHYFKV